MSRDSTRAGADNHQRIDIDDQSEHSSYHSQDIIEFAGGSSPEIELFDGKARINSC